MIAEDGSVIKIGKSSQSAAQNPDMSSFLRRIQEDPSVKSFPEECLRREYISRKLKTSPIVHAEVSSCPISSSGGRNGSPTKEETIAELVKEMVIPLVQRWINENLPSITGKVVETEVRKILDVDKHS
jgi:hypothetical protein